MENLGAKADSRYTGFREITDRNVLDLQCILLALFILLAIVLTEFQIS